MSESDFDAIPPVDERQDEDDLWFQGMDYGMGTLQLLGVVFVTQKFFGVIDWSWWLVLLPFYGPIVLFVLFAVFCGFMALCHF